MALGSTGQASGGQTRLLTAAAEAFRQPDVRAKILFTLGMLLIFRFVAHIPVPGVDRAALAQTFSDNRDSRFLNLFSGGALENLSVAALGVYPYITATIVMQLASPLIPRLQALQQEGEAGRNRLQMYTHWLTVPLAAFQGYAQLLLIQQLGGVTDIGFSGGNALPTFATIISMVAGTMFLVWLGELISEHGVGNGVSLIILGGIVAGCRACSARSSSPERARRSVRSSCSRSSQSPWWRSSFLFQEAQRRVPVQYARSDVPWRPDVPPAGAVVHPAARQHRWHDPDHLRHLDHDLPPGCRSVRRRDGRRRMDPRLRQLRPDRALTDRIALLDRHLLDGCDLRRSSTRWSSSNSRISRTTCSGRADSSPGSDPGGRRRSTSRACWCGSPGVARSSSASSAVMRSSPPG